MNHILAIDPGTDQSAFVMWNGVKILGHGIEPNAKMLKDLRAGWFTTNHVAVEMIACYGMPVGAETFETCRLIGRIEECVEREGVRVSMIYRKDVKLHLCQSMRAKDTNIRQALIDRIGPQGTKKAPGPTYGIKSHIWAALAVAVYAHDINRF